MKNKMKWAGYICIIFAAFMTVLVVFDIGSDSRLDVTVGLISTWLLTGTGLLTANATKRIVGGAVMANNQTEAAG